MTRCPTCNADFAASGIGGSATLVRLKQSEPLDMQSLVDDLVDTLSPRFQGLRRLGQGGMGVVYVARDPLLKRDVAVKLLSPEFRADDNARERFVREAQAAAAVAHPNVVNIFQVGELKATRLPYFVMQFIEGSTVEEAYPRGSAVPEQVARRIMAEVASALGAAHARGLVHRDVKPSNIMLDPHTGRAIVLDFGISASVQQVARDERLTSTGVYIGTPRYMSPEQATGEGLSEKSDVYSLGCVAYELLAGKPLFEAKTALAMMAAHMRDLPAPLRELRPGIDTELAALVARCLEKDPARRPQADEIVQRLAPGAGSLLEWPPPGLDPAHGALNAISRTLWLANALVLLCFLPLVLLGPGVPALRESSGTLILLIIGAVGIAGVGVALRRANPLRRVAQSALRNGYGWLTVLEVAGDPDGETGSLITGSRRFAALSPQQRSGLRLERVRRAIAFFAGGVLIVPTLYLLLIVASLWSGVATLAPAVLLIPAVAALIMERSAERERRAAPPLARAVAVTHAVETAQLAPIWYDAFEKARSGQAAGAGRRSPIWIAAAALAAVGVGLVVLVGSLAPVVLVSTLGATITSSALPKFANTTEKVRLSEVSRPHALPRDGTNNGLLAGTAYYALQGTPDFGKSRVSMLPQPVRPPRPWDVTPATKELFPGMLHEYWPRGLSDSVMDLARRGASPAQLAWLKAAASAPHWKDWDLLARAKQVDALGAMFVVPFPDFVSLVEVPIPRFIQLKEMAYASASRAAWFMSQRQFDSAEAAIRSTISVGFTIADNGNTVIERLIGIVLTGIGRAQLVRYYGLVGDPRGARLKARFDSAVVAKDLRQESADIVDEAGPAPTLTAQIARARALSVATRRSFHRSLRLEFLFILGLSPCTNARELAFGPDADVRQAFTLAREELVRFPSDLALIDLIERSAVVDYTPGTRFIPRRLLRGAEGLAGALLNNPRLPGCASILSAGGMM